MSISLEATELKEVLAAYSWVCVYEDPDRAICLTRGPFTHDEAVAKLEERLAIEAEPPHDNWRRVDLHNAESFDEEDSRYLYVVQISRD